MILRNHKLLFSITLLYFALGFINIHFALLGIACMTIPFILLARDKKKTWCQGYCPRASLYTACGRTTSKFSLKTPDFFIHGGMKWIMLAYFALSMSIIILSTLKIGMSGMPPLAQLRFLLFIPVTDSMPQLVTFSGFPDWLTHLAYRFYSMMMTTTFLGLVLALVYKPRTWCTICPISTVSGMCLKKKS